MAGIPPRILLAYKNFQENLTVRNSVAGGLGMAYTRRCGIPQGCPMSMTMIALLLRPWDVALQSDYTKPRMLADDLLVYTRGVNHMQLAIEATNFTHKYLHDMGAKVAPKKSYMFSSCKQAREVYANFFWPHVQDTVPVTTCIRDLGGQLNTTGRPIGTTINSRIDDAIAVCRKVQYLSHDTATKARIIRGKVLPMALYGVENSHPSEAQLHRLQSAIVDALGNHSARRSLHLCFEVLSCGDDLDPHVQQFTKRMDTFRRMWRKHPTMQQHLRTIWATYAGRDVPGICKADTNLADLQAAPHVDTDGRADWRMPARTNGPLGYLLNSTAQVGAALDVTFTVHKHGEAELSLQKAPKKIVHQQALVMACNARCEADSRNRTALSDVRELDRHVLKKVQQGFAEEDRRIYNHICTLSCISNDIMHNYGQVESDMCPFCKKGKQTVKHLLWVCEKFEYIRELYNLGPSNFNPDLIPDCVLYGIPPALGVSLKALFGASMRTQ